jgi:SAM-dependent methyltransferase
LDASDWDERYRSADLVWSTTPNAFVVEEVADLAPGRVLDLAGGEGRNALWLAERGWDAELVEFSEVALGRARDLARERGVALATTSADVTAAPMLEPADLVLLCYLQLPEGPLAAALRHAASLVAPGGRLLVVAHERDNLEHGVGGPPDPAVLPSVGQVVAALDGSGLRIERAEQVRRPVVTEGRTRDAIDLVVRCIRDLPAPGPWPAPE